MLDRPVDEHKLFEFWTHGERSIKHCLKKQSSIHFEQQTEHASRFHLKIWHSK